MRKPMASLLKGKRVLMFSPFGSCKHYTDYISKELSDRGALVHVYDERPSQSSWAKSYMYLFRKFAPGYFINYIKRIVKENSNFNPDIIFVVRGQGFDKSILEYLKNCFKNSKFIFYQWDPIRGERIKELLSLYDTAFSFDKLDSDVNPEFIFRPSFFVPEYLPSSEGNNDNPIYDICFIGTLYNNRWKVIKRFQEGFKAEGIKAFFYLYVAGWPRFIWDFLLKGTFLNPRNVSFTPMGYLENVEMVKKSKCVLDIVYSRQTGLSMRAFESAAARRKYITTNSEVKNYDFYNPNNILVVDIDNPIIPRSFIDSEYAFVDDSVLYKYSIAGFVDDVFEYSIKKFDQQVCE